MNVKKFMACLVMGCITAAAYGENPGVDHENGIYNVHVTEPGTFGLAFLQTVGGEGSTETTDNDWKRVRQLTITGTLNEDDLQWFVRMTNMDSLNVSGVTGLDAFGGCRNLPRLKKVTLAPSMHKISQDAFRNCDSLKSVNLENVDTIGTYAFYHCYQLQLTTIPLVKQIGNYAFTQANAIVELTAPLCQEIGVLSFESCAKLEAVVMPELRNLPERCFASCSKLASIVFNDEVTVIGSRAFESTNFTQFPFPSKLQHINSNAFMSVPLTSIVLPEGTLTIWDAAFSSCPLRTVTLPSTLQFISNYAQFSDVTYKDEDNNTRYYLTDVYNYATNPFHTKVFNESAATATLHVPYMSIGNYKLSDAWWSFGSTVSLEQDMEDVLITDEFYIISQLGIADKANVKVQSLLDINDVYFTASTGVHRNTFGHLTVTSTSPLSLGEYTQYQYLNESRNEYTDYDDLGIRKYWNQYPYLTTMIAKSKATADKVTTRLQIPVNKWMFISFPYDVKVSNITVTDGTLWTIRRYSGENRASGEGDTWVNVTSGETLEAHKGYILRCSSNKYSSVQFKFPAENNAHKNTLFSTTDIAVPLAEYEAEYANNRSWNLVGNPFAAYFFIQNIDYNAPITIYSHSGYQAYTPWDDEYMMRPNEAFFVQKPIDCDEIIFRHSGAQHSLTPPPSSKVATKGMASTRALFNFYLSNGEGADRARLVLNDAASAQFEMNWDAQKMMSDDAPQQIYLLESGLALAINERPAQASPYALGYTANAKGELTITLEQKSTDYAVLLTDALTGQTVNLAQGAYTFETEAGMFDDRFTVTIEIPVITGADMAVSKPAFIVSGRTIQIEGGAVVYNAAGQLINKVENGGSIEVEPGLYIIKSAAGAESILVK